MSIINFSRSWDKGLYTVLKGPSMYFYKDQKHYKQEPERCYRNERPIDLKNARVDRPKDYTKRKNVFKLELENGGVFLFEAQDEVFT